MRAARLHGYGEPLRLEEMLVPEPTGDQVLVRVAGAGVCRSDIHVIDGELADWVRLPVIMGHEIAGRVERLGPEAKGLEPGEGVVVFVGWGCGYCEWCTSGHEQICPQGREAGSTAEGGFAEYVLVPHRRHLLRLGDLDPVKATPLGCAGISAYAGVDRVRPCLPGGATAVVIGVGGLGQFAVGILRAITGARVIAVDRSPGHLARATALGADETLVMGPDTLPQIKELTGGAGAHAVLDFVGTDETLALAAKTVRQRGVVALLGLWGGTMPFSFYGLAPEAMVTTVYAGTRADLEHVVALARTGQLSWETKTYSLQDVNKALEDLRAGRIEARAVLIPGS